VRSQLPILITGASGFLGSRVTKGFLQKGLNVYAAGRNEISFHPGLNCHFVQMDLQHDLPVDLFSSARFGSVVHLASFVPSFLSLKGFEANDLVMDGVFLSTLRLLKAIAGKTDHLVYASSTTVYGNAQGVIDESFPCCPVDYYGMYKLFCEELCRLYAKQFSTRLTILRFTQLYGPGEPHGIFLQRVFLGNAREGKPIQIFKGGRDEKDFLWIEDAATAVLTAVEKQAEGIYNIASGTGTSVKTIAEVLCREMGSASELVIKDDGSPALSSVFSIDLARKELNFNPEVSMNDGLARLCR
jgi:UDP-glucose 4-epimerase